MSEPISAIILVHQEAGVIEQVVRDIYEKVVSKIPGSEFIVCEDGSTDGTKEILERCKDRYALTLHMGDARRGYTLAMREAFALAKNPVIFFSDSDGQHDPDDFWKLYPFLASHDMVVGWKRNRRDGFLRQCLTVGYNAVLRAYFGMRLHDIDCGFRVMKKDVVEKLLKRPWRLKHCISSELTVRAVYLGFSVAEQPVVHLPRTHGESRGLPLAKLPNIIMHILRTLPLIKREARIRV